MSVLWAKESFIEREYSVNEDRTRSAVRVFRVRTDSDDDGAGTVLVANGIPRRGEPYVERNGNIDFGLRALAATAQQDQGDSKTWIVRVQYTTGKSEPYRGISADGRSPSGGSSGGSPSGPTVSHPSEIPDNPLLRPAKWRWSSSRYRKGVQKATRILTIAEGALPTGTTIEDSPIDNSAGEPYDPPPEIDVSRLALTYTRNQLSYDPVLANNYTFAINEDPFLGFDPGLVRIEEIAAESQYEEEVAFWIVTYRFEIAELQNDWRLELLDAGFWEVDGSGNPTVITDTASTIKPAPTKLDGLGGVLAWNSDAVYRLWSVYRVLPFSVLGIP